MKGRLDIQETFVVIYHINIIKRKNHMIILIDTKKQVTKIKHLMILKKATHNKLRTERNLLNLRIPKHYN